MGRGNTAGSTVHIELMGGGGPMIIPQIKILPLSLIFEKGQDTPFFFKR